MLVCASHKHKPILYAAHGHVKLHVHNNEEMAFDYTEVQVFSSTTRPENVDSVGQIYCRQEKKLFHVWKALMNALKCRTLGVDIHGP